MKRLWMVSLAFLLLLLSACGSDPVMPEVGTPEPETEVPEEEGKDAGDETAAAEPDDHDQDPYTFFMDDGTTAKFKGEGNEFAAITLRTVYLPDNHIAVYEDNGGTVILRVYRLEKDRVDLVKEQQEFYEEYTPTAEELQALNPISLYYKLPVAAGDQVKEMTVVQTDAQVETPYRNFEKAILLERTSEDGSLLRTYLAEGFGEVKREFRITEGDEEFVVSSSLEAIK